MKLHLSGRLWLSLFALAAATLAFEINLTRLFSVAQFYHLAFMIVSIALLGSGASGTALAVLPGLGRGDPKAFLGRCALAAGASILLAYFLTNGLPFDSYSAAWDWRQIPILGLHFLALATPFFFSALALGSLLSHFSAQAGAIYSANLLGSACGCLVALLMPSLVGGDGAVVIYAGTAGLASLACLDSAGQSRIRGLAWILIFLSVAAAGLRAAGSSGLHFLDLRISPYKALSYALQSPGAVLVDRRWNGFSRVDVVEDRAIHAIPGLSYRYLQPLPAMKGLFVDGDDLSPVVEPRQDATFVSFLPSALAFELRPSGANLILGPRGGLDVLTALTLGSGPTTVVEANPLITRIAPVYDDPRLEVYAQSERSFLSRSASRFQVIIVSLPHGYHPVRSGAYSLAEDYRYTTEAYRDAIQHLAPGGVILSTRWLQDPPSEDLRHFALAVEALEQSGGDPKTQLVAFRGFNLGAVILKNGAYAPDELLLIRQFLESRAFDLSYAPDVQAQETNRHNVLRTSMYYQAYARVIPPASREAFIKSYDSDIRPPTDDRPFFGHYFRWGQVGQILAEFGKTSQPFGGAGYLVVAGLLLLAIVLAAALIVLPVAVLRHSGRALPDSFSKRDLLYFGALGFGFLLVEIPLLQMFMLYLEQPAYSVGVVLASLLLFSGIGSRLSPRIPLRPALAAVVIVVAVLPASARMIAGQTLGLPLPARMCLAALMLMPAGVLMGVPFPSGIRLLAASMARSPSHRRDVRIPWAWAINGAASVVASIVAALLALSFGFAWVLRIGALCYAIAFFTAARFPAPRQSPRP